jgi:tetraacyldisaccharide 4'-kinase
VFYAPLDYASTVRRVLRKLRPSLLIVLETEIWPNLWHEARRAGARVLVVNGRISDRAWPRSRALHWFFSAVLEEADVILAQSEVSQSRYAELGAPPAKLEMAGNLKYSVRPSPAPAVVVQFLLRFRASPIWIAASTMPPAHAGDTDEHDAVLEAFERLTERHSGLLLVLAPRKPEQLGPVCRKLKDRAIRFVRRSQIEEGRAGFELPGVLVLDTMGELSSLFELADVVFMGGTLAFRGGHNILEPAFAGKPVICGPHLENFADIAREFRAAGALLEIEQASELASAVERLLEDRELRMRLGSRGRDLARSRSGALERAGSVAIELANGALPGRARGALGGWAMAILTAVWSAGSRWKQWRDSERRRWLPVPVVSVGGLAMGGSGKTPLALWLGGELSKRGLHVAFLTRGYRRRIVEDVTLAGAGTAAPPEVTGDEGQLLVRSGIGPVGIGGNRHAAGMRILGELDVDAFILDDGFQHWRLGRSFDIVLVDALDAGGGGVFPAGRLREPMSGLGRAHAIVITRARAGYDFAPLIRQIRLYNTQSPVFLSRLRAVQWMRVDPSGAVPVPRPRACRMLAFCGLGNPATFWNSLAEGGIEIAGRRRFADHHSYRRSELESLRERARRVGAEALVTTEKDAVNLPPGASEAIVPFELYILRIEAEVDEGERLTELVIERISTACAGNKTATEPRARR